jgi:anti-sigma regulatory factor (Ser/Thr protein kinase)
MHADDAVIQLKLVSDPRFLCGARELVASVAERLGFSDEACAQLKLAVDEALSNVIRHGYGKRMDGPIWLGVRPVHNAQGVSAITIVIEDEAKQVDPNEIRGRDLSEVRPGGLGVHIIHEVMDEVRYEKREGAGMRLTMTKHRAPRSGGVAPTATTRSR